MTPDKADALAAADSIVHRYKGEEADYIYGLESENAALKAQRTKVAAVVEAFANRPSPSGEGT